MSLLFDIVIPNIGIWVYHMRQHVVYILDLSMTLTFDLYMGGGVILSEFYSQFLSCLLLFTYDLFEESGNVCLVIF